MLCAVAATTASAASAPSPALLDSRVTGRSIADTICRPGYVDEVSPSLDSRMRARQQLLRAGAIPERDAGQYALDHRIPLLLGGSPDAAANLDLLPWSGLQGERRKSRLAVMLRRCVCAGSLSLAAAQAAIVDSRPSRYDSIEHMSCSRANPDTPSH